MVLLHPPTSRPGYTGGTKAIGDRQALEMGRDDQGHSGTVKKKKRSKWVGEPPGDISSYPHILSIPPHLLQRWKGTSAVSWPQLPMSISPLSLCSSQPPPLSPSHLCLSLPSAVSLPFPLGPTLPICPLLLPPGHTGPATTVWLPLAPGPLLET